MSKYANNGVLVLGTRNHSEASIWYPNNRMLDTRNHSRAASIWDVITLNTSPLLPFLLLAPLRMFLDVSGGVQVLALWRFRAI